MRAWQIALLVKPLVLAAFLIFVRTVVLLVRLLPPSRFKRLLLLRL
jgi:hypothetical protein